MKRPSVNEYYLNIAKAVSGRSTCLRKHYGAVIVKNSEVVSTGFNGPVRGEAHCGECSKISCNKDMAEYFTCPAVHAEMNTIISASRSEMLDADLYLAGFDGIIFNPTNPYYDTSDPLYLEKQTEWERKAMLMSTKVVLWIPRPEEHQALTTNIELDEFLVK